MFKQCVLRYILGIMERHKILFAISFFLLAVALLMIAGYAILYYRAHGSLGGSTIHPWAGRSEWITSVVAMSGIST